MPALSLIGLGVATSIWTSLQVLTTHLLTLPYWRYILCFWALAHRTALIDYASNIYLWKKWPTTTILALYYAGIFLVLFPVVRHVQWFWHILKQGEAREDESEIKLKTLILPSRTTHSRLFPQKHSFSYSYLLVGIPITSEYQDNAFVSAEVRRASDPKTPSLFSVGADRYLFRGDHESGLYEKLRTYLAMENESIEDYAHIYLVTAPRFGGYSFNPVSFWYLCDVTLDLKAMILEVNNTFDERRMYFLRSDTQSQSTEPTDDCPPQNGTPGNKFRQKWPKDFHVSPFNSRKGSYTLSAHNPFQALSDVKIDNTITLSSSKSHAKLVARIFMTGPALDPLKLSPWEKLKVLAQWWWVGFFTYPRIVKEAGVLFFKRRLHVWFRPEVRVQSLGRNATDREEVLRKCFEGMLESAVTQSTKQRVLDYRYNGQTRTFTSAGQIPSSTLLQSTLDVLTPQFFSDIVLQRDIAGYIRGMIKRPENERTCLSSGDLDLCVQPGRSIKHRSWRESMLVSVLWRNDNQLDAYASQTDSRERYVSAVWSTVLASKLTFGVVELLDGLRVACGWTSLWIILNVLRTYITA